jgi:hypothetical protein
MLDVYEFTIFVLLASEKRKEKSASEHWYCNHYEKINISKERKNKKRRRLYLFFDNPMSLPRKEKNYELIMFLMNDH